MFAEVFPSSPKRNFSHTKDFLNASSAMLHTKILFILKIFLQGTSLIRISRSRVRKKILFILARISNLHNIRINFFLSSSLHPMTCKSVFILLVFTEF